MWICGKRFRGVKASSGNIPNIQICTTCWKTPNYIRNQEGHGRGKYKRGFCMHKLKEK